MLLRKVRDAMNTNDLREKIEEELADWRQSIESEYCAYEHGSRLAVAESCGAIADRILALLPKMLWDGAETRAPVPQNEMIIIPCLYCQKPLEYAPDSLTAQGVFNSFCSDDDCEDRFAATL